MKTNQAALDALGAAIAASKRGYADVAVNKTKPCIICEQEAHGDAIFDAACAHYKALTANTWQTIDTIPDDGSVVFVYCPHAQWPVTTYKTQAGFRATTLDATHWMHLPPKPEQPPC